MKNRIFSLHHIIGVFILACALWCSSCNHYYYAPNDAYLMSLSEKGDVKTSISTGNVNSSLNSSRRRAYNVQLGFSPIKHLGIQGSFFKLSEKESDDFDNENQSGNGRIGEIAIGAYQTSLKDKEAHKNVFWVYDCYIGMGWGEVNNHYETGGFSNLSFKKIFIQGGIHLHVHKNFTTSFGLMFGGLDYTKATLVGNLPTEEDNTINSIKSTEPFFIWSPSLRMQLGIDQAKVFVAFKSVNISTLETFEYLRTSIQVGFLIEPDEFFRTKAAKKVPTKM